MKKATVLKFFKNRVSDVAAACGVSPSSVSQWGEIIPERNALKLERVTEGKLKYRESFYRTGAKA